MIASATGDRPVGAERTGSTELTVTVPPRTVVHYTDTASFGGAERMLLTLLAEFDRSSWRPLLMLHDGPGVAPLVDEARGLGVPTHVVRRMGPRRGVLRLPSFVRELRRLRPALFHAHLVWPLRCTHALIGARLAGIPTVATQQLYVQLPSFRAAAVEKLVSLAVGRYLAVSRDMQRLMRERVVQGRRVELVHNAVPATRVAAGSGLRVRRELLGAADGPLVLTLARLDWQKGLATLVQAAAQVPDALFAIAGEGPERAALEAERARLGIESRVLLLGHRTDVADLLAACDLYVLPSSFEGLPVSVLEAMAAGKPVVASDVGGTNEAVRHGENGVLVPAGDAAALATAIRRMLADPLLAARMGGEGRARVSREFTADVFVRRVTAVYGELLGDDAR